MDIPPGGPSRKPRFIRKRLTIVGVAQPGAQAQAGIHLVAPTAVDGKPFDAEVPPAVQVGLKLVISGPIHGPPGKLLSGGQRDPLGLKKTGMKQNPGETIKGYPGRPTDSRFY